MNLKVGLAPKQGYNKVFERGELRMALTTFGVVKLAAGTSWEGETGAQELALVLIGGNFSAEGEGWKFEVANGRKSPFAGKPHCLYLPRNVKFRVTALTDAEFAANFAPATRDTARPTLIRPEDTRHLDIGRDNFFRTSEVILDETFDSECFYVGEGMIPSGNWSGYPPHRHEVNNPPAELEMEETYFYLFDPQCGFGIQKVYKPDGSVDETYTVKDHDTVAIRDGYHPLCGAPGYQMYYLWTMAGTKGRGLKSTLDPVHAWAK